jgi:hypothetical protein
MVGEAVMTFVVLSFVAVGVRLLEQDHRCNKNKHMCIKLDNKSNEIENDARSTKYNDNSYFVHIYFNITTKLINNTRILKQLLFS